MTDYERLKKRLAETAYLAANAVTGEVSLLSDGDAAQLMMQAGRFPVHVIMHLRGGLETFSRIKVSEYPEKRIGKGDREFKLSEIAKIMGTPYITAYSFCQKGLLRPSVREFGGSGTGEECEARFSWQDAFVAGVIGALRRQGLNTDVLRKVPALFEEKKRTPRKVTASRGS